MARFGEHFANERNKQEEAPKVPKKEKEMQEALRDMKREQHTNDRVRKLIR